MTREITISVDGIPVTAVEGMTIAAAILNAGLTAFRRSPAGEVRAPLCGMGICFECRVRVGEQGHVRSCMVRVENGMEIVTRD